MRREIAALAAGLVFGLGLAVSQMVNPAKVLAFLDVTGAWDPSLAFVMAGAVAVFGIAFRMSRGGKPMLAEGFRLPTKTDIDAGLLAGSALFGIGWGLVGYCPGPAVSSLAYGRIESVYYLVATLFGTWIARRMQGMRPGLAAS